MWAPLDSASYVVWGASSINPIIMPSSLVLVLSSSHRSTTRVAASWSRVHLHPITKLPRLRPASIRRHPSTPRTTKKKIVPSSPRSCPYAGRDLVMPCFIHRPSRNARRPLFVAWPALTRDARCSTMRMKHTDPSTCRSKKEASVTYKGPHRQCIYHYTCFASVRNDSASCTLDSTPWGPTVETSPLQSCLL
jgi:hypothetical protein